MTKAISDKHTGITKILGPEPTSARISLKCKSLSLMNVNKLAENFQRRSTTQGEKLDLK